MLKRSTGSVAIIRSIAFTKFPPNAAFNLPACSAAPSNVSNLLVIDNNLSISNPVIFATLAKFLKVATPAEPNLANSLLFCAKPDDITSWLTPNALALAAKSDCISIALSTFCPKNLVLAWIPLAKFSLDTPSFDANAADSVRASLCFSDIIVKSVTVLIKAA